MQFTDERLLLRTESYKRIFNNSNEFWYIKHFYANCCIASFTIGLLSQVCRELTVPLYNWKLSGPKAFYTNCSVSVEKHSFKTKCFLSISNIYSKLISSVIICSYFNTECV